MLHTTPFLLFNGNCAEAMTFYQTCLGGELTLIKLRDTPMKAQFPEEKHNRIIYARVKNESNRYLGYGLDGISQIRAKTRQYF